VPRVSIILTSFNHAKYLRGSIESVLAQTFTDFELLVWDDASSDESWQIIGEFRDERIRAIRNQKRMWPTWGINEAIRTIPSENLIAIHHSDDLWEREKLAKQVAYLDTHLHVGAVFSHVQLIDEQGAPFQEKGHFYERIFEQPNRTRYEWLRFFFLKGNALCHPSVLLRKSCHDVCGLYRQSLAQLDDLDMWIRVCQRFDIHVLPERLTRFRIRDQEANTSGNRPEVHVRANNEYHWILQNYRQINSVEELVKIFPEARAYDRGKDTDSDFVLAQIALELRPYSCTRLFGLDLLQGILTDPSRAAALEEHYQFGTEEFIALTGSHDAFNINTVRERDLELSVLRTSLTKTADAKAAAEAFAHDRLAELTKFDARLKLTQEAKADAERLAIERLIEIERLQKHLAHANAERVAADQTEALQLTQVAKANAERLAVERLADLEILSHQVARTQVAKDNAENLALEREQALKVALSAKTIAERLAIERLTELQRLSDQLAKTQVAKDNAEKFALDREQALDVAHAAALASEEEVKELRQRMTETASQLSIALELHAACRAERDEAAQVASDRLADLNQLRAEWTDAAAELAMQRELHIQCQRDLSRSRAERQELQSQLEHLGAMHFALQQEFAKVESDLAQIHSSRSWRFLQLLRHSLSR
jgi:glycosyltransferase involved in cell wall biosynthesis